MKFQTDSLGTAIFTILCEIITFLIFAWLIYPLLEVYNLPVLLTLLLTLIGAIVSCYIFYWIISLLIVLVVIILGLILVRK